MTDDYSRAKDDQIWAITDEFRNKIDTENTRKQGSATYIELNDYPQLKLAHHFATKIPDAIIAGGVARDILMGEKISDKTDIDIFIAGENSELAMARQLIEITSFCSSLKITPHLLNIDSNMPGLRLKADNLDLFLL